MTAAQRQAALSARQSYAAALSGVSQVHALETAVAAGHSAVKGNRIGYGLGIRINSDVLSSEQQLYSTLQDLDKARYDALFEGLKLKAATGELSAEDYERSTRSWSPQCPAIYVATRRIRSDAVKGGCITRHMAR